MPESNRTEYKRELTDNLEKEVVAFLNSREGGIILLGVGDTGEIIGIADTDSSQLKMKDRLRNNTKVLLTEQVTEQVTEQDAEQVTPQVTPQVEALLSVMNRELSRTEIQEILNLTDKKNFTENYLKPALEWDLIEMTVPDKPRSSLQRYRLTMKGKALKKQNTMSK